MRRITTEATVIITVIGDAEKLEDEDIILATELKLNSSQIITIPDNYTGNSFQVGARFHLGQE